MSLGELSDSEQYTCDALETLQVTTTTGAAAAAAAAVEDAAVEDAASKDATAGDGSSGLNKKREALVLRNEQRLVAVRALLSGMRSFELSAQQESPQFALVNALPRTRAAHDAAHKESFFFGHDQPVGLRKQLLGNKSSAPLSGGGSSGGSSSGSSGGGGSGGGSVSVFFGGCGDCRHVFATILDLAKRRTQQPSSPLHANLVINDIHEFSLAQFAVTCVLLEELRSLQRKADAPGISEEQQEAAKQKVTAMALAVQSFMFSFLLPRDDWDSILKPTLLYVQAHFSSKVAEFAAGSTGEPEVHGSGPGGAGKAEGSVNTRTSPLPLSGDIPKVWSWLVFDVHCAKEVVAGIDQWLKQENAMTASQARLAVAAHLKKRSSQNILDEHALEAVRARARADKEEKFQQVWASRDNLSDEAVDHSYATMAVRKPLPPIEQATREEKLEAVLREYIDMEFGEDAVVNKLMQFGGPKSLADSDILDYVFDRLDSLFVGDPPVGIALDVVFFWKNLFLPPHNTPMGPTAQNPEARTFLECLQSFRAQFQAAEDKQAHYTHGLKIPRFKFSDSDFVWNPVCRDLRFYLQGTAYSSTQFADGASSRVSPPWLSSVSWDGIDAPAAVEYYCSFFTRDRTKDSSQATKLPPRIRSVADWAVVFFGDLALAIEQLATPPSGFREPDTHDFSDHTFTVTMHAGDVFTALDEAFAAGHTFDEIRLSNIPDYTGLMPVFTSAVPALKHTQAAIVRCNNLLNTGMWDSYQDYVYHHSFSSLLEAELFLRVLQPAPDASTFEEHAWQRKLGAGWPTGEALQQRPAFRDWLTDVLLHLTLPPKQKFVWCNSNPVRATRAMNLTTFFRIARAFQHTLPVVWHAQLVAQVLRTRRVHTTWSHHPTAQHPLSLKMRNRSRKKRCIGLGAYIMELGVLATLFDSPARAILEQDLMAKAKDVQQRDQEVAKLMPRLGELRRVVLNQLQMLRPNAACHPSDASLGVALLRMNSVQKPGRDTQDCWSDEEEEKLAGKRPLDLGSDVFGAPSNRLVDVRAAMVARTRALTLADFGDGPDQVFEGTNPDYAVRMQVIHLISTCAYTVAAKQIEFLMPVAEYNALCADPRVYVVVFNYNNWIGISTPKPLAASACSEDLRFSRN